MRQAKKARPRRAKAASRGSAAKPAADAPLLVAEWPLSVAAALGSSVRVKGIEREIRARLPWLLRNGLTTENGRVALSLPASDEAAFADAARIVAGAMAGIDALPVLPSEVEDILTITAHERQKWLKDGRLKSAGTRTVKLRGRAKTVTFHVFDPRTVEDILDRDLATIWRDEDAQRQAENRRRAAGKAARTRKSKADGEPAARTAKRAAGPDGSPPKLAGWDTFAVEGLLR